MPPKKTGSAAASKTSTPATAPSKSGRQRTLTNKQWQLRESFFLILFHSNIKWAF